MLTQRVRAIGVIFSVSTCQGRMGTCLKIGKLIYNYPLIYISENRTLPLQIGSSETLISGNK